MAVGIVVSNKLYSPQAYCSEFFGVCPIFNGDENELRDWLDKNGHGVLWDYPLEEITTEVKSPVVLVDTTYISESAEMVMEYRWFEVPKRKGVIFWKEAKLQRCRNSEERLRKPTLLISNSMNRS